MKIRLMGSSDLVRAWKQALEQSYNLEGAEYPSRRGGNELGVYFDLDDRVAAEVVEPFLANPGDRAVSTPIVKTTTAVARRGRKGIAKREGQ